MDVGVGVDIGVDVSVGVVVAGCIGVACWAHPIRKATAKRIA
jgi:hypothetical protein